MSLLKMLGIKGVLLISLGLASLFCSLPVYALSVHDVPNPRLQESWVTDMVDLLTPRTEQQLDQWITDLEAENGTEIAIVTVPETAPATSPKSFATKLFNTWHIGKKGINNGILILVSHGDRRIEIETGSGARLVLPDQDVQSIINTEILPYFKENNFDRGILEGTQTLTEILQATEPSFFNEISQHLRFDPSSVYTHQATQVRRPKLVIGFSILLGGLVLTIGVLSATAKGPIYVQLGQRSRVRRYSFDDHSLKCAICSQPLQQISSEILDPQLTKAERVAQRLGTVEYKGWSCSQCSSDIDLIHIRAYTLHTPETLKYNWCPNCEEMTVLETETTIDSPTTATTGSKLVQKTCQSCSYHEDQTVILPILTASSSSDGGFSGSSSFGGGFSSGGGAGGSW